MTSWCCRCWKAWILSEKGLACTLEALVSGAFTNWYRTAKPQVFPVHIAYPPGGQAFLAVFVGLLQQPILHFLLQVYEILDNAIDEVQSGFAHTVKVSIAAVHPFVNFRFFRRSC